MTAFALINSDKLKLCRDGTQLKQQLFFFLQQSTFYHHISKRRMCLFRFESSKEKQQHADKQADRYVQPTTSITTISLFAEPGCLSFSLSVSIMSIALGQFTRVLILFVIGSVVGLVLNIMQKEYEANLLSANFVPLLENTFLGVWVVPFCGITGR